MKPITGTGVKLKCGCEPLGTRVMKSFVKVYINS